MDACHHANTSQTTLTQIMTVSTAEWSESVVGRIVSAGVLYRCGCSQAAGAVLGVTSAGHRAAGGPVHSAGEGWSGHSSRAGMRHNQHNMCSSCYRHTFSTQYLLGFFFNWMPLASLATENNQRNIATEDF